MKRALPFLLVPFLLACSGLGASLTSTPVPITETSTPPATDTPIPPSSTNTSIPSTATPSDATSFPDPSAYHWTPVVSGLDSPVDIQFPDDGSGRMFLVEQSGRIRVFENGRLLAAPFLDITDRVGRNGNEQGLLGLAFHPDFQNNPYFYVNYTDRSGNTVVARFQASGDSADPASEKVLLRVDQPFQNHNGGRVVFGPDGYLYLSLGDGGSGGDPYGNGQNTNVLLGKILRIDVDGGDPYAIPAGNPFADGGGRPEIWAFGLRNPWRFSFDSKTGDLYIADVGQNAWEEVDFAPGNPPGLNYGWNYYEGNHVYAGNAPAGLNVTFPVAEYSHAGGNCSITGGFVYRGAMPEWQGIYLYGDYCSGRIWGLLTPPGNGSQPKLLFETGERITAFGQDPTGEVYFAGRGGTVYRLGK